MLTELSITNLGVIDAATITLPPGFTAVTGETGAGKTMVVGSLALVAGGRADAGLVRRGADRAVVAARFSDLDPVLVQRATELGAELDGDELLVARHLTGSRSRAWLGGAPVPATAAAEVAGELVTIHGQSEQVRLSSPERQREVLDRAAGPEAAASLARYRDAWWRRRAVRAELAELITQAQARNREMDLLAFGLDEIAAVDPQPGEDVALAEEARRLQDADDLRLAAQTAVAAVAGDDDLDDAPSALGLAVQARKALEQQPDDPQLAGLAGRLAEAAYALGDVAAELSSYLADLDADPRRLEAIAERRAALQQLTRKYGDDVDAVLAWAAESAARLAGLQGSDDRIEELRAKAAALDAELAREADTLTGLRAAAATRLAEAVREELRALALPHARLEFRLTPLPELGPAGAESVQLLFTANPGSEPGPLSKVASGGELSRVRLALEVTLADTAAPHTFVFDEVDAGVGGATALEIGRRLARLAQRSQVVVVTHLAQVAAFADAHLVVSKAADGQVTTSGVAPVTGRAREAELARMMGGLDASSARAHARDLLAEAARR